MKTINTHEAKTHLSRLLKRVAAGEEIVIASAGRPVARLVPIDADTRRREVGFAAGQLRIDPAFDAPLPEAVLASFYGTS